MIVKYIAGVSGRETILNQEYEIAIAECNPYTTAWNYSADQLQYGSKINRFEKDPLELEITLKVRGSISGIGEKMDQLFKDMESDIIQKKEGKLYIGEWYARGYFIEHASNASEKFYGREMPCVFIAPYPFWVKDVIKEFYAASAGGNGRFLDYKYDYRYDYTPPKGGVARWTVDHYAPSEFSLTIFGPCTDPRITINGYPYEVFTTLEAGEYLTIDSRANTVTKHLQSGTVISIFDYRNKQESVFEKIPSGALLFSWSGTFGFTLTLYTERSEPEWRSCLQT